MAHEGRPLLRGAVTGRNVFVSMCHLTLQAFLFLKIQMLSETSCKKLGAISQGQEGIDELADLKHQASNHHLKDFDNQPIWNAWKK